MSQHSRIQRHQRFSAPLVVVGHAEHTDVSALIGRLEGEGFVVYPARGLQGCLRVATATSPDLVLIDSTMNRAHSLATLLAAHPATRFTQVRAYPFTADRSPMAEHPAPTRSGLATAA